MNEEVLKHTAAIISRTTERMRVFLQPILVYKHPTTGEKSIQVIYLPSNCKAYIFILNSGKCFCMYRGNNELITMNTMLLNSIVNKHPKNTSLFSRELSSYAF